MFHGVKPCVIDCTYLFVYRKLTFVIILQFFRWKFNLLYGNLINAKSIHMANSYCVSGVGGNKEYIARINFSHYPFIDT